jgi:small subunit ribosomal protein S3
MIERKFITQKIRESQIQEYMAKVLSKAGYSHTEIHNTPLGEKITIYTTRPGLVVGKSGENVKKITAYLKKRFKLENPQIEIGDVQNPLLDVQYVADRLAYNLERFGAKRFKSIGYKMLQDVMNAGAVGAEIVLSGRIPSARARSWRFSAGYLKKSGDIAVSKVKHSKVSVNLTIGTVGVKVSIMTPDIELPDKLLLAADKTVKVEEVKQPEQQVAVEEQKVEAVSEVKTEEKPKAKRAPRKKKEEKQENHGDNPKE